MLRSEDNLHGLHMMYLNLCHCVKGWAGDRENGLNNCQRQNICVVELQLQSKMAGPVLCSNVTFMEARSHPCQSVIRVALQ